MFARLVRVLFGFIVACFAAGLTMVLFVVTPSELAGLPPDVATDRAGKSLRLAVDVATQAGLFATPFALVVGAVGEWRRKRTWSFYAFAGVLIAILGFLAQQSTEQVGQPTIVNNYAVTAFITSGFVGGVFYWLFSGRHAGGRTAEPVTAPTEAKATADQPAGTPPEKPSGPAADVAGDAKPEAPKVAEAKVDTPASKAKPADPPAKTQDSESPAEARST